jgi:hypothetical protein
VKAGHIWRERQPVASALFHHLGQGAGDVCVDNLLCYAAESYLRGTWVTERRAAQQFIAERCVVGLLDRLVMRHRDGFAALEAAKAFIGAAPVKDNNVLWRRRFDATITLVGDAVRFNVPILRMVDHWARARHMEQVFADLVLDNVRQCSFFIRSFFLTWYSAHLVPAEFFPLECYELPESLAWEECDQSEAAYEASPALLQRLHSVRLALVEKELHRMSPEELFAFMAGQPAAVALEDRPQKWLVDESCTCLPPLRSDGDAATTPFRAHTTPEEIQTAAPFLATFMIAARVKLVTSLMAQCLPEDTENVDNLTVITTTLLVFAGEFATGGVAGAHALLRDCCAEHKRRRAAQIATSAACRVDGAVASCPKCNPFDDPEPVPVCQPRLVCEGDVCNFNPETDRTPASEVPPRRQCVACGRHSKLPPATIRVRCLARNFFSMLCIWIAHYACQRRYFHTLFHTTLVDVPVWRNVAMQMIHLLPQCFDVPV